MASVLLIDQETFREEKAKQGICSVPAAIRDDCLSRCSIGIICVAVQKKAGGGGDQRFK